MYNLNEKLKKFERHLKGLRVKDIYVRRKRSIDDKLFNDLNNYHEHENIKFTVENAPKKFLDTQILCENKYQSCF